MNVGKYHKHMMTKWNDPDWKYFDVAMIHVKAGDGGHGVKSFRREAFVMNGGPDGGNGGRGGDVYLKCMTGRCTLHALKSEVHYIAEKGDGGMGKCLDGKRGASCYVPVPPGSCIYVKEAWLEGRRRGDSAGKNELVFHEDVGTRHFVGELTYPGQLLRVARGGRGGRGNRAFKTLTNNAPWISERGSPGMTRWIEIELKLISDVGIIGVPNAGKSSLLSAVTNKEAKIAAYPFTTVVPNLGVYDASDMHGSLTLCDVPGLIEGAHDGRGMGIQFLRHIERCRTLVHVVSGNSEDPLGDFDMIQAELREYSTEVSLKPQVVVVNKCDIPEVQEYLPELMKALRKRCGHSRVFDVSVATRYHLDELMQRVFKWHQKVVQDDWRTQGTPCDDAALVVTQQHLLRMGVLPEVTQKERVELDTEPAMGHRLKKGAIKARVEWDVLEDAWRMKHPEVERVALTVNWMMPDAATRFNNVCKATGMTETLAAHAKQGDDVIVGNHKFKYSPEIAGSGSRMLIYEMDLGYF